MRMIVRWVFALLMTVSIAPAASAHSLKYLEQKLTDKEQYFQVINKPSPDFTLRDADGRIWRLEDLREKVLVLHFIYAGCPDICPLHAERIAELQTLINPTPMKDMVRFITITTDPVNDTTEVLRDYGPAHGLDSVNWLFLTTTPEQPEDTTRQLAAAFGHRFAKVEGSYQVHGTVTHIVDREGRWRANFHGLDFESVNLVMFVNALTNDVHGGREHEDVRRGHRSWWSRIGDLF